MREGFGGRVEPVQPVVHRAEPQMAAAIGADARHRMAAEAVGICWVVNVSGTPFGPGVELVDAWIGGHPQKPLLVFEHIAGPVVAQTAGIAGIVLVHDERMAVVAIEAFARRKPHEAQAVLHDGEDTVLRQPIVRGEMREFQVPDRRHAALCELNGAVGIGRSALCERPVPPACADERDDCEQERKALQTISRPDSCGTHRAIFV